MLDTRDEGTDESLLTITPEGWIIDPEGVIVGKQDIHPQWRPETLEDAEWVLNWMQQADSEIAAAKMRLQAVTEQLGAMLREREGRRQWLDRRFGPDLEQVAKGMLDGKKIRSVKTAYGTLSFRTVPARVTIREGVDTKLIGAMSDGVISLPALLDWARANCPEAVKMSAEFQISKLPKDLTIADLPEEMFTMTEETDAFKIDTGIKT